MARFKLVSKSWYAAAQSYISSPVTYKPLVPQAPWLLLPRCRRDGDNGRFYSLSENKVYPFKNLFEDFAFMNCWVLHMAGCSCGALTYTEYTFLTPSSRAKILLSPLGLHHYMIIKAFLSSDPSCNNTFYVVVLYTDKEDTRIAFHKHIDDDGNNSTTWADLDSVDGGFGWIFFHNSLLFGIPLDSNSIRVCNFRETIKTIDFQRPERDAEQQLIYGRYLVESQGELLFVEKLLNPISGQICYDIHKLNFTPNKVECLKVECLQDQALVLSPYGSASVALSTLDIPELEANSIYAAEDKHMFPQGGHHEMYLEAYNLESIGFKSILTSQVQRLRPLLWIVPSPF